jgi:hypothetical protein
MEMNTSHQEDRWDFPISTRLRVDRRESCRYVKDEIAFDYEHLRGDEVRYTRKPGLLKCRDKLSIMRLREP